MAERIRPEDPGDDSFTNTSEKQHSDWSEYAPPQMERTPSSSHLSQEISSLVDQFKQAKAIASNEFSSVRDYHDLKMNIFGKLMRLAQDENSSVKHEAIEALIEVIPGDGTKFMKDQLCELLSRTPEHIPSIVEFVFDPSHKQIRLYAANLLRHEIKNDPSLAEQIIKTFNARATNREDSGKVFLEGVCLGLSQSSSSLAHGFLESVIRDTDAPREAQLLAKIGLSQN